MSDPVAPTPPPATPVAPAAVPGKSLGVAGVIFAILIPVIGLILSLVARSQSKAAGVKNNPATAGIIISIILIALYILFWIIAGVTGGISVSTS